VKKELTTVLQGWRYWIHTVVTQVTFTSLFVH